MVALSNIDCYRIGADTILKDHQVVNRRKKKGALPPRAKRMDPSARLQFARGWLKTYNGKNIAAGYRRHFAVDWPCAFRELEMLGVRIDAAYKDQILKSVEGHIAARGRRKSRRGETDESRFEQDETFAYVAGYTEAGFAYGITWEEWGRLDQSDLLDPQGDSNTNFNDEPPELPFYSLIVVGNTSPIMNLAAVDKGY